MHIHSYLQSVQQIVSLYKGDVPFAAWLKFFFKEHKKFGSKDRKYIAHLCYCYFRLGRAFAEISMVEKIGIGLFLCSGGANSLLQAVHPEWNERAHLSVSEKLQMLNSQGEEEKIFAFNHLLSKEIETVPFNLSFLVQPPVYLRLRPGKAQKVKETFLSAGVPFKIVEEACIAVGSNTKVEEYLQLDADAVVQDWSSQRVLEVLPLITLKGKLNIWDCCAASGGKSILAWDHFQNVSLTVSDIRQSILYNLRARFSRAGIHPYHAFVADVSKASPFSQKFDLVICDAPCSGSGTWGRTPEQLLFFEESKVDHYASLQKRIVTNAAQNVKKGGYLLYITCSVFERENEYLVRFVLENLPFTLHKSAYLKGYDKKSDTLFAAAFTAL